MTTISGEMAQDQVDGTYAEHECMCAILTNEMKRVVMREGMSLSGMVNGDRWRQAD